MGNRNPPRPSGSCRPLAALLGAALVGAGVARGSLGGLILGGAGAWLLLAATAPVRRQGRLPEPDIVDEASAESFPASDPPAFTPGRAGL